MDWRNVYRGFLIGTSDLIPGVSGGTIAVMLGIYDRLLAAIGGVIGPRWREHGAFLLPLLIGMGVALVSLSRVIAYLLTDHYVPTQCFFVGLILGVLPLLLRRVDAKKTFGWVHGAVLIASAAAAASLAFARPAPGIEAIIALTPQSVVALFFSGWAASMAMLLPGISGSFVLLVLGVYPTAIYALSTLNIPLLATIGAGIAVGFVVSSKAISFLLSRYETLTHASIIGLIIGSAWVVFPGFDSAAAGLSGAVAAVIGFVLALRLGR